MAALHPVPESLLAACVAVTDTAVVIADASDPEMPVVWANPAFERTSGYPVAQVLGRNARFMQGPDTDPEAVGELRRALAVGRTCRVRLLNYRPNGSTWWNEMHLSPLRDAHGAVTHVMGVQHDVSTQVFAEQLAARAGTHDVLTGLANRSTFTNQLEHELSRGQRDRRAVAVLFLDVDRFKAVNDRWGHAAGDALLTQLAERLQNRLRGEDLVARLGGDEFLALVVDLAGDGAKAAAAVIADLSAALAAPFVLDGTSHWIGVSIGAALHPRDGDTAVELIAAADRAMYQDKQDRAAQHDAEQERVEQVRGADGDPTAA